MGRVQNKFVKNLNPYDATTEVNYEGFPTFQRSDEEAYLQVLLTNTLGGTFYASEEKLLRESLGLHAQMTQDSPQFAAKAIVYARNEGLMRMQPVIGLAHLAKRHPQIARQIFSRVILTPGDLADFVEIVRGGVVGSKGMGRAIKRMIANWLLNLSEYHALKYATGGQGYAIRDILRLVHPKTTSEKQNTIFMYLTQPDKWLDTRSRALTPQLEAFEMLKKSPPDEYEGLIASGKLPYEIVTGVIQPDKSLWSSLMRQMPYMALMRHLNTLQKAGVLADQDNAAYVATRMNDAENIHKAKILPFRLFTAYKMFNPQNHVEQAVSESLVSAIDKSFVNLPDLEGVICIAPDVSGSMSGQLTDKGATRFIDVAGIFAAALLKKSKMSLVLPFESRVVPIKLSAQDSMMTTANRLAAIGGGGTSLSAPIKQLIDDRTKVDIFIGITDSAEWVGSGFVELWQQYKRHVSPKAKAFLIQLAPYRHAVAPQNEPDVYYIYGWSDSILKFIALTANGLGTQVDAVNKYEL